MIMEKCSFSASGFDFHELEKDNYMLSSQFFTRIIYGEIEYIIVN